MSRLAIVMIVIVLTAIGNGQVPDEELPWTESFKICYDVKLNATIQQVCGPNLVLSYSTVPIYTIWKDCCRISNCTTEYLKSMCCPPISQETTTAIIERSTDFKTEWFESGGPEVTKDCKTFKKLIKWTNNETLTHTTDCYISNTTWYKTVINIHVPEDK